MSLSPIAVLFVLWSGQVGLAQTVHVVDATGQYGKFTTIIAAVAAAKSGDTILIHPGTHTGQVDLNGKALALIGFNGKATGVVISVPPAQAPTLRVRNHPKGMVSRFASLSVDMAGPAFSLPFSSIDVATSQGDLVFQNVKTNSYWTISSVKGTVTLNSCDARINPGQDASGAAFVLPIHPRGF